MSYAPAFGGRPWRMKTDKQAMSINGMDAASHQAPLL